ncbi:MAG: carboxypeptidase-like regulatory domain-containing protein [Candidatus Latescibacterota bacterium]
MGEKQTVQAVSPDGHFRGKADVNVDSERNLAITAKQISSVSVQGAVVDPQGKPASGVGISLMRVMEMTGRMRFMNAAVSDERGRFEIQGLEVDNTYAVFPSTEGLPPRDTWFVARENLPPLKIVMAAAEGWLEGIITDSEGVPMPGVEVISNRSPNFRTAVTDSRGYYRLEGLIGNTIWVHIQKKKYGYYRHVITPLCQKRDFTLIRADRFLSGVVTDERGKPLSDVGVYIKGESGPSQTRQVSDELKTDENGRFRYEKLNAEMVELLLLRDDIGETTFETETNREGITIVMKGPSPSRKK